LVTERHPLVYPFPDTATSNAWCALYDFPLAVVVFEGDAKRMAVLREDDGTVSPLVEVSNLRR
jgi:hypothetical protein